MKKKSLLKHHVKKHARRVKKIALRRPFLFFFSLFVTCFSFLAVLVHFVPVLGFDVYASQEIQEPRAFSPALPPVMEMISFFGNPMPLVLGVALVFSVYWFLAYHLEAIFILLAAGVNVLTVALKLLVNRPRPEADLVQIYQTFADASFPSGHVTYYVAFFGFIGISMFFLDRLRLWVRASIFCVCLVLIVMIPFSRVYLGAHWLTDVVGGFLLGSAFLMVLTKMYVEQRQKKGWVL